MFKRVRFWFGIIYRAGICLAELRADTEEYVRVATYVQDLSQHGRRGRGAAGSQGHPARPAGGPRSGHLQHSRQEQTLSSGLTSGPAGRHLGDADTAGPPGSTGRRLGQAATCAKACRSTTGRRRQSANGTAACRRSTATTWVGLATSSPAAADNRSTSHPPSTPSRYWSKEASTGHQARPYSPPSPIASSLTGRHRKADRASGIGIGTAPAATPSA
jgi:hypothetical protein